MNFSLEHEIPGRIRLRCPRNSFTREEGAVIGAILETQPGIVSVAASCGTGSLLVHYTGEARDSVLKAVELMDESLYGQIDASSLPWKGPGLGESLACFFGGVISRALMPFALRRAITFCRAMPLLGRGIASLWNEKRLNVSVLDAAAVGVSMLRRDFGTASVITTLLALGNLLESWTHKKARESLADSLAVNVDKLWVRRNGREEQISVSSLQIGDLAVIRTGSVIPVDGVVFEGDAMVNQASMTGESEPVHRVPGLSVYAGTVIEEGELTVRVTAFDSDTRIRKIADMIDESEALKADVQNRAEKMADAIVPYSFILAGAVYMWTRNASRATSALLVDYSCALKLSTPLIILSAMREGARRGILVKGGKFLEYLAEADTVVFDKTGTLTVSSPSVAKVIPFGNHSRNDVLRTAACLEEHFPHSIARAVVKQAELEGLSHIEEHSTVEYAVAHGIASHVSAHDSGQPEERILLGSVHFVIEDEGISPTPEQHRIIDEASAAYSVLLLAIGDGLAGILCVEDPLRKDAVDIAERLLATGVRHVVMLTGDNPRAAENIASIVGIREFYAQLLPEDKTEAVKRMKSHGRVVMAGDGINDAPALSAADVGVTLRDSADIARETADVVLTNNNLNAIIDARLLGREMMKKIRRNGVFIVGANSLLLALGLYGIISPAGSALLHNLATVGAGVYSLTPILDKTQHRKTPKC
jgi:heavy metal translocating P-type ATPase